MAGEDALTHFRIQLRVWRDAVRSGDEAAFSQSEHGRDRDGASPRVRLDTRTRLPPQEVLAQNPPGAEIMADFMTDARCSAASARRWRGRG